MLTEYCMYWEREAGTVSAKHIELEALSPKVKCFKYRRYFTGKHHFTLTRIAVRESSIDIEAGTAVTGFSFRSCVCSSTL